MFVLGLAVLVSVAAGQSQYRPGGGGSSGSGGAASGAGGSVASPGRPGGRPGGAGGAGGAGGPGAFGGAGATGAAGGAGGRNRKLFHNVLVRNKERIFTHFVTFRLWRRKRLAGGHHSRGAW